MQVKSAWEIFPEFVKYTKKFSYKYRPAKWQMYAVSCRYSIFGGTSKRGLTWYFKYILIFFLGNIFPSQNIMTKSAYVFAGKFLASNAQQCVKSARIRSYSDRYFPAFALNTPFLSLSLSLRIQGQGECGGEMRTRISPNTDTFYAAHYSHTFSEVVRTSWIKTIFSSRKRLFFLQ